VIADVVRQVRCFSCEFRCALCMLGSWGTRGGVLWKHQQGHFSRPHLRHDARLHSGDFTAEGSRRAGMSGTALMTLLDLERNDRLRDQHECSTIKMLCNTEFWKSRQYIPKAIPLYTCRLCFCLNLASRSTTSEEVLELCHTQYGTTDPGRNVER